MRFVLIRHGKTQGNFERRYIGSTDEALSPLGIAELEKKRYPAVDGVFCSPMLRCIQTARLIYPDVPICIENDLRECDFGDFEGKNYDELKDDSAYLAWLASGGEMPFPNGESRKSFAYRSINAFEACMSDLADGNYAFVVHGGTIMALMEHYAHPQGTYYDFQVQNGHGYILNGDGSYEVL